MLTTSPSAPTPALVPPEQWVYTNAYFRLRLEEEAQRARRERVILNLLLLKSACPVQELVRFLRAGLRKTDPIGLWKDAVAVLMPESYREETIDTTGFQHRLARQALLVVRVSDHLRSADPVPVSIGACFLPEAKGGKILAEDLITGAEAALHQAQQTGKTVVYQGPHPFFHTPAMDAKPPFLEIGDVRVDTEHGKVWIGAQEVSFVKKEYDLLLFLLKKGGKLVKREHLCDAVWGYQYFGTTRTVDAHVVRVRRKLKPSRCLTIQTIKGQGYRLDVSEPLTRTH